MTSRRSWVIATSLILAVQLHAGAQPAKEGKSYAFLVGVSGYKKTELKPLPYTPNDVLDFKQVLLQTGFEEDNIIVLHDRQTTPRFFPEREKILAELRIFLDGVREHDTVVIALSGHGVHFKGDKFGYFCPLDAELGKKSKLIPMDGEGGLFQILKACRAQKKLLLVNACRNDPFSDLAQAARKAEFDDSDTDEVPEGIAALYSCREGQKSYYDPDRKRGIFFDHVIRAWKTETTLEAFFEHVVTKTKADVYKNLGEAQVPVVKREYKGRWEFMSAGRRPPATAVTLHELFSDHAVLQADRPILVWGWASPGGQVTVELHRGGGLVTSHAIVDRTGRWKTELAAQAASAPGEAPCRLVVKGDRAITLSEILIGEVWVCSGQSNMQWSVRSSDNPEATIQAANDPWLRLYTVPRTVSSSPLDHVPAPPDANSLMTRWYPTSPSTVPDFSAVAYHFGVHLRQKRRVPVGLIHSSWGGTPAQAWTSKEALNAEPSLTHYHDKLPQMDAERRGRPLLPGRPSGLFNAMISPLIPFSIRGAIWYQGESNTGVAYEYRKLFPTMINDWRDRWNQGEFPFLFVQLAPFMKRSDAPGESTWAELREAQLLTSQRVRNTAMAVITDLGNETDIHPKMKQPVGERLGLAARALAYGERIPYSGPIFESKKIDGSKVILTFRHAAGGLEAKGGALTGFTICGGDGVFVPAEAEITGPNTVAVWSRSVRSPKAVRFGWANYPVVNLWNKAGLPASPFRTD